MLNLSKTLSRYRSLLTIGAVAALWKSGELSAIMRHLQHFIAQLVQTSNELISILKRHL